MKKYEIGRTDEGYEILTGSDYTDLLVDFVLNTNYDNIPEESIDIAKQAIIDSVGVIYAAVAEPMKTPALAYLDSCETEKQATVIGINRKTSMVNAAFINGCFNHCIDFDDCCFPAVSHSTTTYLGTMLAIGEHMHLTGKDMIVAYVIGHEVYNKIAGVLNPECWYSGHHATGIFGTVAAAAVGGKLLGLDRQQLKWAIGIACSSASGLKVNLGSMTKPYHAGHSCEIGVQAAILAKNGFTSRDNALEGRMGYGDLYARGNPHFEVLEELGKVWDVIVRPPFMKPHPSCGGTHAAMNAIRLLKKKHDITPDMVEKIEMGTNPGSFEQLIYPDPKDPYEARFSATFTCAVAMVKDRWGIANHTQEVLDDPEIQAMMKKVHLYIDDEITQKIPLGYVDLMSRIRITLKDGRVFQMDGKYPILSWDEVFQKYCECCSLVIPEEQYVKSYNLMKDLENLDDVAVLMEQLS